jgi:hypothetical protein
MYDVESERLEDGNGRWKGGGRLRRRRKDGKMKVEVEEGDVKGKKIRKGDREVYKD